jgi:hypothetical protein
MRRIFETIFAAASDVRSRCCPGTAFDKSSHWPGASKADGKQDFSGVWQSPRMADITQDEGCCKGVCG